jgi:hypothetical protein
MERAFFLLDRGHAFNGCTILSLRGPLSESLLRAAVQRLEARHPLLRVRVERTQPGDDRTLCLTDEGARSMPVSVVPRHSDSTWQDVAMAELNARFPDESDHLNRLIWVRGRTQSEILIVSHHVLVDALSAAYAMRDLIQELAILWRGGELPPVESLPLRPPLPQLLSREKRGLSRLAYMNSFFYKHILGGLFRGARKLPHDARVPPESRRTGLVHRTLSGDRLRRLGELSKKNETSVHAALCAALLLSTVDAAFAEEKQRQEPLTLGCWSAVSLRHELEPKVGEELGLYISQVTTFHRLLRRGQPPPSLWQLAREVKEQLGRTLKNGEQYLTLPMIGLFIPYGKNPGPRFVRRFDDASPAAIGVTNISRLPIPSTFGPFAIDNFHMVVSPSVVTRVLAAITTFADRLNMNLLYAEPLVSRARATAIVDGALAYLEAAVEAEAGDATDQGPRGRLASASRTAKARE